MPTDLSRLMRSNKLKDEHIASYCYQMVRGLKFTHSAGIMHRDIKPSNILVDPEKGSLLEPTAAECWWAVVGTLKIADFGLAIGPAGISHQLINYVVTRWYIIYMCIIYVRYIIYITYTYYVVTIWYPTDYALH